MVQVEPIAVRVKFRKVGNLQYISHLDLVRTMMKVIVRAKLPLKYTEGFNPKPKLAFAAPLPTGVESECEYMDIRLTERMSENEVLDRLNAALTDELRCLEAYYPENKFTSLAYLSYDIDINTLGADAVLAERLNKMMTSSELIIRKKTKSGERDVDIKPLIKAFSASFDEGTIKIKTILSSSSAEFLSPELLIKLLKQKYGILMSENLMSESYSVMRREAYFSDMTLFK